MKIPDHVIDEVQRRADIVDVVGEYVNLERRGARYWGLSPFTNEKTPSFSVSPDKGLYYCFSSNKGGSVITFIMEMEGLSFPEAVELLAGKYGVELQYEGGGQTGEAAEQKALRELYQRVSGSFRHILLHSAGAGKAREYVARRSISDEVSETYQLGYAPADPGWLYRFLRSKEYSEEFLSRSGLFSKRSVRRSLFVDRLIFPIRNHRGEVLGFGGRQLSDNGPKYINSPDTSIFHKKQVLYGLYESMRDIRRGGRAYLVEGYVDALAVGATETGCAVAPLGTSFTDGQARLLKRYAKEVVLVFDADEAGLNATRRAAEIIEKAGLECRVCTLPEGEDPADILENKGSRALEDVLHYTTHVFDFLVDGAVARVDPKSPEGKKFVLDLLFPYIKIVDSAVKRESYLQVLADRLNVDAGSVTADFTAATGHGRGRAPNSEPDRSVQSRAPSLSTDLFLMIAVALHRHHFGFVRKMLGTDDFEDDKARELYIALEESYRAGEQGYEQLLERIESEDIRALIPARAATEEFTVNPDKAITDAVYRIKQRSFSARHQHVLSEIRRAEKAGSGYSPERLDELLQESMYLDGELQKLKVMLDD